MNSVLAARSISISRLSLYELPIFLLAILGTLQFVFKDNILTLTGKRLKNLLLTRHFELSTKDLVATSLTQLKTPRTVSEKSDFFFQFCIYWMILTMAFYAYVGEKVPWLMIHQLLPMSFVAVYKLNWQKVAFALIGCLFLALMTWHVAFIPADINEPIVQVQELRGLSEQLWASWTIQVMSSLHHRITGRYRGITGAIGADKIAFYGQKEDIKTMTQDHPDVIILHDTESYPSIPGYNKTTYKLDYWFSYYDNQDRLLDYYFHRDGIMGSINLDVFTVQR